MRESLFNKLFGITILKDGDSFEAVSLKRIKALRLVFSYFIFLLLVWGLYRYLIILPEAIDELFLKPLVWLGSLFWVVKKLEKKPLSSLALSTEKLFKNLYWGIGLGFVFALEGILTNIVKYQGLDLPELPYQGWGLGFVLLTSGITALCEELVFRSFIFNRLNQFWKNEWRTNFVVSFLFVLIHLPITIFVLRYDPWQILSYGIIVFVYSLGAGFVFSRTESVIGPILLHVFWSWPIILFR
ncbi:MAG: CPBP family intramembrane metalloprotease [Candidatus Pacebacteria bacterium]|nr:CPBP family intramembrane metalloprotease [Candidatus Paceibacterota bacterium]